MTDQPEQRANLRFLSGSAPLSVAVEIDALAPQRSLEARLREAAAHIAAASKPALARPPAAATVTAVHER